MRGYFNFTRSGIPFSLLVVLIPAAVSNAHHSFAPYDINHPIVISGVAESFPWRRPHPKLTLVDDERVTWEIEVPTRAWTRAEIPQDAIKPGDEVTVRGFPARDGSSNMAMSGFEIDGTYHTVREEIRQRSAVEAAEAIDNGESLESVLERYDVIEPTPEASPEAQQD
jgi:hypothetical protein